MPPLTAFTAETVRRLTGLSDRQLRYWDNTGFFVPSFADDNRRRPHARVYSFRDLVRLRTIAVLLDRGISLQELRKIGAWLAANHDEPWAKLRFSTVGKELFVADPESDVVLRASRSQGQAAMPWYLEEIARQMEEATNRLQDRSPEEHGKIVRNRFVMHNMPVIAGTRIPTSAIYDLHTAGRTTAEIIEDYPRLTEADIREAIAWEETRRNERAVS
jgi:uncharacterized protein (DUF433 family)